jgi:cell division transport system ATP-binding protein
LGFKSFKRETVEIISCFYRIFAKSLMNFTSKRNEMEQVIQLEKCFIDQLNHTVLRDVSMNVNSDELVFLIGKTGSGKSSLLKLLYGEVAMAQGKGTVVGFDLSKLNKRAIPKLRRQLGIVFQDFQLLTDRTVEENLFFVMRATGWTNKKEMQLRAQTVLSMVGLDGKAKNQPHQLSGGEQQRVAIARALANNPKILLADEPTGNLDPSTASEVFSMLVKLVKDQGIAAIIATHNHALAHSMDRFVELKDGKLHESR